MKNDWNLRNFLLALTQRWYLVALTFLIGAFLGWGMSQLSLSTYRADLDLYAGLNAYRQPRDRFILSVAQDDFENVDDYKHWQMEQLNTLALQDDFLLDTLERLRQTDARWDDVSPDELKTKLRGSWRNAGRWHLTAETRQREMAIQAVETWAAVIDERVNTALEHARQVVALDTRQVRTADEIAALEARQQTLIQVQAKLEKNQTDLEQLTQDQPLDSLARWDLLAQASRAADWGAGWQAALDAFPAPDEPASAYLPWTERILALIAADLDALPSQRERLEAQYDDLAEEYIQAAEKSLALSPNLSVETPEQVDPQVEVVRPVNTLMLVGGILGVLTWLLWKLARFSRESESA
jgi:hypothetical protein